MHPIETHYLSKPNPLLREQMIVQTIKTALIHHTGNILVFLPGMAEIRRIEGNLQNLNLGSTVHLAPLYGDLAQIDQDQAIQAPPPGHRKIVLATNIAETSLTIDGIRIVIDSGLVRVARFDPRSGMSRLETVNVSKDSADQRRGRSGRLESGICYRLWTAADHQALLQRTTPEMLEADLTTLTLELALWGTTNPKELRWLDAPPPGAYVHARELLSQLGAIDSQGHITSHGKQIAELPLHPRLAHMVLKAKPLGLQSLSCELAVLLSERDFFKAQTGEGNSDIRPRVDMLHQAQNIPKGKIIDRTALHRILKAIEQLKRQLNVTSLTPDPTQGHSDKVGLLLAFAYPDRIAKCQNPRERRYRLSNGRGAYFSEPQALSTEDYLVIAQLDGAQQWARIFLAAPVLLQDLEEYCPDLFREVQFVAWDERALEVTARNQHRLGELAIQDHPLKNPDPDQVTAALLQGLHQQGIDCLPWTKELRNWQARVLFLRRLEGEKSKWPDVGDQELLQTLEEWLAPYIIGMSRLQEVRCIDLKIPLHARLSWNQHQELDQYAPTHLTVPTGSRIPLRYHANEIPVLSVRLQELFGQSQTPKIAGGKIPVMIHLLSPARRPVQVTQDLASFWLNSYQEVKKELKGRYPKHYWPDDPQQAKPTKRTKSVR